MVLQRIPKKNSELGFSELKFWIRGGVFRF